MKPSAAQCSPGKHLNARASSPCLSGLICNSFQTSRALSSICFSQTDSHKTVSRKTPQSSLQRNYKFLLQKSRSEIQQVLGPLHLSINVTVFNQWHILSPEGMTVWTQILGGCRPPSNNEHDTRYASASPSRYTPVACLFSPVFSHLPKVMPD